MSNSSDKEKADRGNDTPPDAPYEVRNKKPPRSSSPVFWQSEGSPERKRQSSHAGSAGAAQEHRGDQERTAYTDAGLGRHRQSSPRVVDEGRPQGDPTGRSVSSGGDGERDGKARRG